MRKLKHITEVCREIYEKEGFSAVCDYVNKYLEGKSPIQMDTAYEFCKACNTEAPAWRHICLCCGQPTKPIALNFIEELRNQAQELIDLGDSREKARGQGMMDVINAIRPMPNHLYFELMAIGVNKDLQREEIQIHAGENGNIMIVKTPEGFVVDVYNQDDNVNTMTVWEDDLTQLPDEEEPFDPKNHSLTDVEDFIDEWGQYTDEVCAELGYDEDGSDDLLMVDFFYHEESKKWIPKCSSMYTERDQAIADYLRLG